GIALYLLELFKFTKEEKYKDAAVSGMHWVLDYCEKNPSEYYALFTGRLGVPFALLRMAEVLDESHWQEKALELAKPCSASIEGNHRVDDLINGSAGTLLGLLHLHSATGEKWIVELIDRFALNLLEVSNPGPGGMYWDRSHQAISGLCGFSHGAAGIGYVYLEMGRYFKNDAFFQIAHQAFLYESFHFNESMGNWEDLRNGIYGDDDEKEHKEAYLANNMEFFTKGKGMNAWCHGAAGIGLSRLRACEILKDTDLEAYNLYRKDLDRAVKTTTRTDANENAAGMLYILCHGGGGNAEVFLKAYELFKKPEYLELAEVVARRALDYHKKNGFYVSGYSDAGKIDDTSLFMGTTGVGYFLLRLLDPLGVPSILAPSLKSTYNNTNPLSMDSFAGISLPGLTKHALNNSFRRTQLMAEKFLPRQLSAFLNTDPLKNLEVPLKHSFSAFIEEELANLPEAQANCLSDIFILENEELKLDEAVPSNCLLFVKSKILADRAAVLNALDLDAFLELDLVLEEDANITVTDWNWSRENKEAWESNPDMPADDFPMLVKLSPMGINEMPLSPMTYTIIECFEEGSKIGKVREETISAFEELTPDQVEMLKEKIIDQIKQLLHAGILVEVEE
ncbi:MAG: hypothetical protein GY765_06430, partial [bacterium]|nr:hypothetical protein [bacterium]